MEPLPKSFFDIGDPDSYEAIEIYAAWKVYESISVCQLTFYAAIAFHGP